MEYYIFGYASLFNPASITTTLGHKVERQELRLAELHDYSRSWNLVAQIMLQTAEGSKPVDAVFLDIQPRQGKSLNGVLFKATLDELAHLDVREKQYDRVDITSNVSIPDQVSTDKVCIFTYVGKPEFFASNYQNPKILRRYNNIVLEGLEYWGKQFEERFYQTTEPHAFEVIDGSYKFLDEKQNIVTGHS